MSKAQYQYTLQGEDLDELECLGAASAGETARRFLNCTMSTPTSRITACSPHCDRPRHRCRLGRYTATIDNALYDAFGQRQVSTMYTPLNQYHVVMEVDPQFQQTPDALQRFTSVPPTAQMVPLCAFAHFEHTNTSLAVNHQGQFPSVTLSFNLAPGVSLGDATTSSTSAENAIGMPGTIHASFQGTRQAFQDRWPTSRS